jgi:HD superfamily phosphohydrolase
VTYDDEIYGRILIEDPILERIMNSAAMQRLHGVLQHGITGLIGITREATRFEHSVGTMLLVGKLGGSREEQIAALIHDVSHTAFSHVIDYVFHGHIEQNYHDAMQESYISTTDLPSVLESEGYNWQDFLNEGLYPLLEQPAPALCADRIDYFLRDALGLGLANKDQVVWALSHLVVSSGRIAIDDIDAARWFGNTYMQADRSSWANFREVALYELTAMAIRRGLEIGEIEEGDFWGTDAQLWRKLQAIDDPLLRANLDQVNETTQFIWDDSNYDFVVATKLRTLDPDILMDSELRKLSSLDTAFAEIRTTYLDQNKGEWPIRIVRS